MIKYGLAALLAVSSSTVSNSNNVKDYSFTLPSVEITAKRIPAVKKSHGLNTNIVKELKEALDEYSGPKLLITSMVRFWNNTSPHRHGKAVDCNWSEQLIDYLVTEKGRQWVASHNLMYYIEAKPGDRKLLPYKTSPIHNEFVFENKYATGPHIHIQIKK